MEKKKSAVYLILILAMQEGKKLRKGKPAWEMLTQSLEAQVEAPFSELQVLFHSENNIF